MELTGRASGAVRVYGRHGFRRATARTHGASSVYAVRMQGFASVREFLDEFWEAALSRLEELARE